MLNLGNATGSTWITFGLEPGDVYAAKNSFVVKAEIGKATAAHEH